MAEAETGKQGEVAVTDTKALEARLREHYEALCGPDYLQAADTIAALRQKAAERDRLFARLDTTGTGDAEPADIKTALKNIDAMEGAICGLRQRLERGGRAMSDWQAKCQVLEMQLTAARATIASLQGELERKTAALTKIEKWFGEFPPTGEFWPKTDGTISDRPMSYGACFGSNGERDYMRSVARAPLGGSDA